MSANRRRSQANYLQGERDAATGENEGLTGGTARAESHQQASAMTYLNTAPAQDELSGSVQHIWNERCAGGLLWLTVDLEGVRETLAQIPRTFVACDRALSRVCLTSRGPCGRREGLIDVASDDQNPSGLPGLIGINHQRCSWCSAKAASYPRR